MELRQQLDKWQRQADASYSTAADMDVAKRLLKHGIEALDEIDILRAALLPLTECHIPPNGSEQHGVTAHFTTEQIIAAKKALRILNRP